MRSNVTPPARLLAAIELACAFASPVPATVLLKMNLKDLSNEADVVFVGTVVALRNEVAPGGDKACTAVTFKVESILAGKAVGKELTLRFCGGELPNGVLMKAVGIPDFRVGEKVVLFAVHDPSLYCPLTGWLQGKLTISAHEEVGDSEGNLYGSVVNDELVRPRRSAERLLLRELIAYLQTGGRPKPLARDPKQVSAPTKDRVCITTPTRAFAYTGRKWPDASAANPVIYRVNSTGAPTYFDSALTAAFATWTAVEGKDFAFAYGGITKAHEFRIDNENAVFWNSKGTGMDKVYLALTITYWDKRGGHILVECDEEFNGREPFSSDGAGGTYDLQTVALHEAGHWLSLDDEDDVPSVMCARYQDVRRTLYPDDIAGIQRIYPKPFQPDYHPDMMVAAAGDQYYTGSNVYSNNLGNQTRGSAVRIGTVQVYYLLVQNDGNDSDAFTVKGDAGAGPWTVNYFDATNGGNDITAQVAGTGWSSGRLAIGEYKEFRMQVKPNPGIAASAEKEVVVRATSAGDASRTDEVSAITTAVANALPSVPTLLSPGVAATLATTMPAFQVSATDGDKTDRLQYRIEVLKDGQTVRTFDQNSSATGWDKADYSSGETATFQIPATQALWPGVYLWRASAEDGLQWGQASACFGFTIQTSASDLLQVTYSYEVAPNAGPYVYPDSGGELTDGVKGSNDFRDAAWVGWSYVDPTIRYDLGGLVYVDFCEIGMNNYGAWGIGLPHLVTLTFSLDGLVFSSPISYTITPSAYGTGLRHDFIIPCGGVQARYARLQIQNDSQWTFIDETRFSLRLPPQIEGPAKLAFVLQPSTAKVGAAITPAIQVAVLDGNGNTVLSSGNNVSIAIEPNPSGGILTGTTTANAVSGIATFSNLSIDKTGDGYKLTASSPGLAGATSAPFPVGVGFFAIGLKSDRDLMYADGSSVCTLTATLVDEGGNAVTTANNKVAFATESGGDLVTFLGDNPVAAVQGSATVQLKAGSKSGQVKVKATVEGLANSSEAITITLKPLLTVSGRVANQYGTGVPGVALQMTDHGTTAVTDSAGNFTFTGIKPGAYQVSVTDDDWFAPPPLFPVMVGDNDITGVGFTLSDDASPIVAIVSPAAGTGQPVAKGQSFVVQWKYTEVCPKGYQVYYQPKGSKKWTAFGPPVVTTMTVGKDVAAQSTVRMPSNAKTGPASLKVAMGDTRYPASGSVGEAICVDAINVTSSRALQLLASHARWVGRGRLALRVFVNESARVTVTLSGEGIASPIAECTVLLDEGQNTVVLRVPVNSRSLGRYVGQPLIVTVLAEAQGGRRARRTLLLSAARLGRGPHVAR